MRLSRLNPIIPVSVLATLLSCMVHGWQPGTYGPARTAMSSAGLSVNNYDRNDVIAFWHAVYQASEGYENRIKWTGNYNGFSGRTSPAFVKDVERRLNFFRALCGVPATAKVNTGSKVVISTTDSYRPSPYMTKSQAAQDAALMLVRNYNSSNGSNPAMSHNPSRSLTGWSSGAWNAAAHGNLAFGIYGPGAISEYMIEEIASGSTTSYWNSLVGHRRWCLYPAATDFASGDQPGKSAYQPATNVFYISQSNRELAANANSGFVSYPAAGFFPAPVNSRYWSLSRDGADFSSARVRMTDSAGRTVQVSSVETNNSYGDPALIWTVGGAASAKSIYQDLKFNVYVTGIKGAGIPNSHSYSVTLINPDRLVAGLNLIGSAAASSRRTTNYKFNPPSGAESLQVSSFLRKSSRWVENAEGGISSRVIDNTSKTYPLAANMSAFRGFGGIGGRRTFHLTFPTSFDLMAHGVPEQSFELKREIVANSNAKLQFTFRRGYMTVGSSLLVERSYDGGVSWRALGRAIKGISNTRYDATTTTVSLRLPKSYKPCHIRFRYFTKPGAPIYTHDTANGAPTGIFIDDISTRNCDWLMPAKTTGLSKNSKKFNFNARSAGAPLRKGSRWYLGLRTKLGNKWFPYGPWKVVRVAR